MGAFFMFIWVNLILKTLMWIGLGLLAGTIIGFAIVGAKRLLKLMGEKA